MKIISIGPDREGQYLTLMLEGQGEKLYKKYIQKNKIKESELKGFGVVFYRQLTHKGAVEDKKIDGLVSILKSHGQLINDQKKFEGLAKRTPVTYLGSPPVKFK